MQCLEPTGVEMDFGVANIPGTLDYESENSECNVECYKDTNIKFSWKSFMKTYHVLNHTIHCLGLCLCSDVLLHRNTLNLASSKTC